MKFRLIALASCVALGSIAFGGKAQAQTADVDFKLVLNNTCSFTANTAGVLVADATKLIVESSSGVAAFTAGTAGKVDVDCTGGGTITVAAPVEVVVPIGFTPVILQSVVDLTGGLATDVTSAGTPAPGPWASLPITPIAVTPGVKTLNVGMIAGTDTPGTLPAGLYQYRVTVTATPD